MGWIDRVKKKDDFRVDGANFFNFNVFNCIWVCLDVVMRAL